MTIEFTAENGYNIMYSEDGLLYAEIKLPEDVLDAITGDFVSPVSEDYGYFALKAAIQKIAEKHGIAADTLKFWYDGQEQHLADDAHAVVTVDAEYRG